MCIYKIKLDYADNKVYRINIGIHNYSMKIMCKLYTFSIRLTRATLGYEG